MSCLQATVLLWTAFRITAVPLLCKRWTCDYCRELLRLRVIRMAVDGQPEKILTLTCNVNAYSDPDSAAHHMRDQVPKLIKRMRRLRPASDIQYFLVVERTKNGWPHFHILLRAPYIPQAWYQKQWLELAGSPIVDIRAIHGGRETARYVGKYLGKSPHRFSKMRSYDASRGWFDPTGGRHAWRHKNPLTAKALLHEPWERFSTRLDAARVTYTDEGTSIEIPYTTTLPQWLRPPPELTYEQERQRRTRDVLFSIA